MRTGGNGVKITVDKKEVLKPLIESRLNELKLDFKANSIKKEYGEQEYKEYMRVSIYDYIQQAIDDNHLLKVIKDCTREDLVKLLLDKQTDIHYLEVELYKIVNGNDNAKYDAYYGMVSNDKIELFELIEEYIWGGFKKRIQ